MLIPHADAFRQSSTKAQETETSAKIHALEQLIEETKSREAQLKTSNKVCIAFVYCSSCSS
jgi:hypothetical protein